MMTGLTILPNTELFTLTADFAGYTLLDGILGDVSPADYVEGCEGEATEQSVAALCGWLGEQLMQGAGYYTSHAAAQTALDEQMEEGLPTARTIESFTPAGVHAAVLAAAESTESTE